MTVMDRLADLEMPVMEKLFITSTLSYFIEHGVIIPEDWTINVVPAIKLYRVEHKKTTKKFTLSRGSNMGDHNMFLTVIRFPSGILHYDYIPFYPVEQFERTLWIAGKYIIDEESNEPL